MDDPSERRFRREVESLPGIFAFIAERGRSLRLGDAETSWADLVVEELFTNMVKYASGRSDVEIRIGHCDGALNIRLIDFDVEAFDITKQAPLVDTQQPIGERTPGGLGLHLVRSASDTVHYEYRNRNSIITVTKRLGP